MFSKCLKTQFTYIFFFLQISSSLQIKNDLKYVFQFVFCFRKSMVVSTNNNSGQQFSFYIVLSVSEKKTLEQNALLSTKSLEME